MKFYFAHECHISKPKMTDLLRI